MSYRQIVFGLSLSLSVCLAQPFPATCPGGRGLPFATIAVPHPVDQACGPKGKLTSPQGSQVQNTVKNNFCVQGAPQLITPQQLIALQGQTHVPAGRGMEPVNRTPLTSLGEGRLVMLKAFIIEAHHADLGGGESVNCNLGDEAGNDVHIALGPTATTQECASITAEISPHFRPASWNQIGTFETFNPDTNKFTVNPAVAARLQAQPFRITGQLFFDASHAPCPCNTTCSPSRSSDWEIHPIYNIEVCKPETPCNAQTNTDWIPFDTWWRSLPQFAPPHTHSSDEGK